MELSENQKQIVKIKKTLLSEYAEGHTMCPIDFSGKEEHLRSELDMIAGSIRRSYDTERSDHKIYKHIVRRHIEDEWVFR